MALRPICFQYVNIINKICNVITKHQVIDMLHGRQPAQVCQTSVRSVCSSRCPLGLGWCEHGLARRRCEGWELTRIRINAYGLTGLTHSKYRSESTAPHQQPGRFAGIGLKARNWVLQAVHVPSRMQTGTGWLNSFRSQSLTESELYDHNRPKRNSSVGGDQPRQSFREVTMLRMISK